MCQEKNNRKYKFHGITNFVSPSLSAVSPSANRANVNDWSQNYEKITDMIVPRSSQLITQDADYALFNVTLFKKVRMPSSIPAPSNGLIQVEMPTTVIWNFHCCQLAPLQVVEEFKLHAREKKFVVRDFTYNEEELAAGKSEITKLVTDKKKQFVSVSLSLSLSFCLDCFRLPTGHAWILVSLKFL